MKSGSSMGCDVEGAGTGDYGGCEWAPGPVSYCCD